MILERRVKAAKREISARDVQMRRVLTDVARVAPGATRQITGDAEDPLTEKRSTLAGLEAQFETLDASYVAMLGAVRGVLSEHGVDPVEAGFEPHASLRDLNDHCDTMARRTFAGSSSAAASLNTQTMMMATAS